MLRSQHKNSSAITCNCAMHWSHFLITFVSKSVNYKAPLERIIIYNVKEHGAKVAKPSS